MSFEERFTIALFWATLTLVVFAAIVGCGDNVRLIKRPCLDQNGNEVPCEVSR